MPVTRRGFSCGRALSGPRLPNPFRLRRFLLRDDEGAGPSGEVDAGNGNAAGIFSLFGRARPEIWNRSAPSGISLLFPIQKPSAGIRNGAKMHTLKSRLTRTARICHRFSDYLESHGRLHRRRAPAGRRSRIWLSATTASTRSSMNLAHGFVCIFRQRRFASVSASSNAQFE
jgi:hypothetical protein